MITLEAYFMGRDRSHAADLTDEIRESARITVKHVNQLLAIAKLPGSVSSGWRPASINAKAGGAKASKHLTAQACDLRDPDGSLSRWCMKNLPELSGCGLFLEHPSKTQGWVHLQTVAPKSGKRVFFP